MKILLVLLLLVVSAHAGPMGGRLVAVSGSSCANAPAKQTATITSAHTMCYVSFEGGTTVVVNGQTLPFSTLPLSISGATTGSTLWLHDVYLIIEEDGIVDVCYDTNAWGNSTPLSSRLTLVNGLWVNATVVAVCKNGATAYANVPAGTMTGIGTFGAWTTGITKWDLTPSPAVGGNNNCVCNQNYYNQVPITAEGRDSTPYWVYGNPAGSWAMLNNSASNRIWVVDGLGQSQVNVSLEITTSYAGSVTTAWQAGSGGVCADCYTPGYIIGRLGQVSYTGPGQGSIATAGGVWPDAAQGGGTSLGGHFFQALMSGQSSNSSGPGWYCNYACKLSVEVKG